MSVLRKYNPTTEQWEILQGGVQGLQGPPVALSKGTVATTPPGTNADFTVTGTPPNQKLNLTVPRGDVGPAGGPIPTGGTPGQFPTPDGAGGYVWSDISTTTYLIVGPGRPDTPATTGGIITGSEPVGAEYRSTDGANVGAWMWMKRPGGKWGVADGDTGSRNVDGDRLVTWVHTLRLRREGNWVVVGGEVSPGSVTNETPVLPLPAGFRPDGIGYSGQCGVSGDVLVVSSSGNWRVSLRGAGTWARFSIGFWTPDPWPTTLPGTPA